MHNMQTASALPAMEKNQHDPAADDQDSDPNNRACPRCCAFTANMLSRGEVCPACLDELEFGYPSFPAYAM
ncbi:hypothetical protein [Paenibacillus hamazuiensis]|uniref:hypothetical protein n=1 Tax=Paenibacillus hamazuiensis TaxID=2936508 RepID=UPI00200E6224|nr:hypothetical protein [Paenibacillus hamazuiensis]